MTVYGSMLCIHTGINGPHHHKQGPQRSAAQYELDNDLALDMAPPMDDSQEHVPMTDLYGDWQTEADVVSPVTDGKIPRNQYGNVEVPPHVPRLAPGLVHLNHPYIAKTCKALQVDYAAAMVGFERRRGGSVPVLQGVVVCEEHAAAVLEAYSEQQRYALLVYALGGGLHYVVVRNPQTLRVLRTGSARSRLQPSVGRLVTSCGRV